MDEKLRKMAIELIDDAMTKSAATPYYANRASYGSYGRGTGRTTAGRTPYKPDHVDRFLQELDRVDRMTPDELYRHSVSTIGRANVYGKDGKLLTGAERERADVAHQLASMPEKQFRQFGASFGNTNPTVAQMSRKLRTSPEYGGVAFSTSGSTPQNGMARASSFKMQRNNATTGPYNGSIAARNAYVGKGTYVFGNVPQSAIAKAQSYRMPTRSYTMPAQAFGNAMARSYASNNAKSYSNRVASAARRPAAAASPRMNLAGPAVRYNTPVRRMTLTKRSSAQDIGSVVDDYIGRYLDKAAAALPRDKRRPIDWAEIQKRAPGINQPVRTLGDGAWSEFGQNLSSLSGNAAMAGVQGLLRAPGLMTGLAGGAVGAVGGFLNNAVHLRNPLTGLAQGFGKGFQVGNDLIDDRFGKYSLKSMRNSIQRYRDWTRDDFIKRNNIDTNANPWTSLDGWTMKMMNGSAGAIGAAGELAASDGLFRLTGKALRPVKGLYTKLRGRTSAPPGTPPATVPASGTPPAPSAPPAPGAPAPAPTPGAPVPAPAPAPAPGRLRAAFDKTKDMTKSLAKDTYNLATKRIENPAWWQPDFSAAGALLGGGITLNANLDMGEYLEAKKRYEDELRDPNNRYDPAREMRRRATPNGAAYPDGFIRPANNTDNHDMDLDVSSYM